MADGILLENGIEWWLSDDKTTWYTRNLGADEWTVDASGKGPNSSSVVTQITELEDPSTLLNQLRPLMEPKSMSWNTRVCLDPAMFELLKHFFTLTNPGPN